MTGIAAGAGLAKFLLDQSGQIAEIRQNHVHQKEQIHWAKRSFHMDSQSLLLDALDHSKEEIRSHYETYVNRIDTPLLVLALIWPFALNTIQFSDPFVPQNPEECPDCIEAQYQWLVGLWVGFMGIILILPFWGILMMIRCKLKLDSWLEFSLAGLNRERRHIIRCAQAKHEANTAQLDDCSQPVDDDTQQMVGQLVDVVFKYQEYLARIWTAECGWLVHASTMLLWMSAVAALLLTSLSMVIFLYDKGGMHRTTCPYFGVLITSGCVLPAVYVLQQRLCNSVRPPKGEEDDEMHEAAFPLASAQNNAMQFQEKTRRWTDPVRTRSFSDSCAEEDSQSSVNGFPLSGLLPKRLLECCRHRAPQRQNSQLSPLLRASSKETTAG